MSLFINEDINLPRGDDRDFIFTCRLPPTNPSIAGDLVDLTGAKVVWTAKRWRENGGPVYQDKPVIVKTSDDTLEIEILDQTISENKGKATIRLLGADTEFVDAGVLTYDVQVTLSGGRRYTVGKGKLYLEGDVTAAEDATVP